LVFVFGQVNDSRLISIKGILNRRNLSESINIKIGGVCYSVNPEKVPYFQSYLRFQHDSGQDTAELIHGDIALFNVAYYGIENGFRQCFRKLAEDLDQYHILCDTLDFIGVDVLEGRSLSDIFEELKSGKGQYECEYKRSTWVKGNKRKARDAAFMLLYLILFGEFKSEVKDSQKAYNAVLFVVSHRAIFKYRTRSIIRAAYEERFQPSRNQTASLNKWPVLEPGKEGRPSDDDATTESSSSDELDWDDY